MNCDELGAQIELAFDGVVDSALTDEIESHLSTCSFCNAQMKQLQAMRRVLRRDEIPAPSTSLDLRVMSAFRQRREHSREQSPGWRTLFFGSILVPKPVFAMSLIILGAVLFLGIQIGKRSGKQIAGPDVTPRTVSSISTPPATTSEVRAETAEPTSRRRRSIQRIHRTSRGPALSSKSMANSLESFATVSPMGANYTTKATLDGFEPFRDAKIRVVKAEEQK